MLVHSTSLSELPFSGGSDFFFVGSVGFCGFWRVLVRGNAPHRPHGTHRPQYALPLLKLFLYFSILEICIFYPFCVTLRIRNMIE